jgi:hypothetical protein
MDDNAELKDSDGRDIRDTQRGQITAQATMVCVSVVSLGSSPVALPTSVCYPKQVQLTSSLYNMFTQQLAKSSREEK